MKINYRNILLLLLTISLLPLKILGQSGYDANLVEISTATWKNEKYIMVNMQREGERIKAKYFAATDYNGNSVYSRYKSWSAGKNIVLVTSGTYMNNNYQPVGLTIDNGVMVNETLSKEFDGLVIVQATGGVVVSNIEEHNLSMKCNGTNEVFDITNSWDKTSFVDCAKEVAATVFQTHLLVYKNELKIYSSWGCKLPPCERERRFLAVCKNEDGKIVHVIVHSPTASSLYDGTKKVFEFLTEFKDMQEVVFMINLDTGYQDVFQLYDKTGIQRSDIKGQKDISVAVNLLVYYYQ